MEKAVGMSADNNEDGVGGDGLLFYGYLLTIGLAPFVIINNIADNANLPQSIFIQQSTLLLWLIWLACGWRQTGKQLIIPWIFLPIVLFTLWSGISITWASNPYLSITAWTHWLAVLLFGLLGVQLIRTLSQMYALLTVLSVAGSLTACLGLAQYYFDIQWVAQATPPAATFVSKNMAVQYLVLTFPAIAVLFLLSKQRKHYLLAALGLVLVPLFTFHSMTRAGLVSMSIELLVFLAFFVLEGFRRQQRFSCWTVEKLFVLGLCFLLLFTFASLKPDGWSLRGNEIAQETVFIGEALDAVSNAVDQSIIQTPIEKLFTGTAALRIRHWQNAFAMYQDNAFTGVGLGNFSVHYNHYAATNIREPLHRLYLSLERAHNDYLQTMAELGTPGILLIILFGISILRSTWQVLTIGNPEQRMLAVAIFAALMGAAINAMFSFPFYRALPPLITVLLLVLLYRLKVISKAPVKTFSLAMPPAVNNGLLIISAVALLVSSNIQYHRVLADVYHKRITRELTRSQSWQHIAPLAESGLGHDPYRIDIMVYLGRAYLYDGRIQEAHNVFTKIHNGNPYATDVIYHMAEAEKQLGKTEQAKTHLLELLRLLPEEHHALDLLGRIFLAENRLVEAIDFFHRATIATPKKANYHFNLAIAYIQQKRYIDAEFSLKMAVSINPSRADAQMNLGRLQFYYLNKHDEGSGHLKAALSLNPTINNAQQIRQAIATYQRQKAKHSDMSESQAKKSRH